ncbi:MAG: hypothetical protein V3T61_10370, partial [Acidobacteriota bacterium]
GFRSTLWDRNLNLPTEFDEFGRGINLDPGNRPDPTIGRANALGSFGRARFQAAVFSVRKAFSRNFQFFANYTLSENDGNASTERSTEAAFGPSDPFNLDADYGPNELDVRHAFKSGFLFDLPYGMSVSSTIISDSGIAYPVYNADDVNGDTVTNSGFHPDRPVVNGQLLERFPFHQPSNFVWDLRYTLGFAVSDEARARFLVEVFNLLNNDNTFADTDQGAIFGSENFRENNRTLGPLLVQVGFRFDF